MKRWFVTVLAAVTVARAMAGDDIMVQRPASATRYRESTVAHFGVWYDPHIWKQIPNEGSLFNLSFLDTSGVGVAMLVADPRPILFSSLAAASLAGLRSASPKVEITSQASRLIGDKEVLYLTFSAYAGRFPIKSYCYAYSGPEGTVQLSVSAPSSVADRLKPEIDTFLNGLQIGAPDDASAQPAATAAQSAAPRDASARSNVTPSATGTEADGVSSSFGETRTFDSSEDALKLNASVPYTDPNPVTEAVREIQSGDVRAGVAKLQGRAKKGYLVDRCLLALLYDEGNGVPKDPAKAVAMLSQLAGKLPQAKGLLGNWYLHGHNLPLDKEKGEELCREAAAAGDAQSQDGLGHLLLRTDPVTAVTWFKKAAAQGNADAAYCLFACYHDGKGVPKDPSQEMDWLKRAAGKGQPLAQRYLAEFYWSGNGVPRDLQAAAAMFRSLALSGSAFAENDYAVCLWTGSGVPMNKEDGLYWFRKAAEQGEVNAEQSLGRIYAAGDSVPINVEEAVKWYGAAAAQGAPDAEFRMGRAYLAGNQIPQDVPKGTDLVQKAARQGMVSAAGLLATLDFNGYKELPPNLPEALKWAQEAAGAGDPEGKLVLGYLYAQGKVLGKDMAKAFSLIKEAAEGGNVDAEYALGTYYREGSGTPPDITESAKWIRKAAESDNPAAEFQLGLYYLNGKGVPKDIDEATRWFRFSALQGFARGENAYGYSFEIGAGVQQDLVEAYKWFILACSSSQSTDVEPRQRALVNMMSILPKMSPEQVQEGKNRASEFVPKRPRHDEKEDFQVNVG